VSPKAVRLFGRELTVWGSDGDDYYTGIVDGTDLTDPLLSAIRPHVAEDSVCIDVGANIGLYTLGFSVLAPRGRVCAVEPSPQTYRWLTRNVEANEVSNVECFQSALGDREGWIDLHDVPFFTAGSFTAEEGSYLGTEALGSILVKVPCTTLDAFVARHSVSRVDVVKIDVEGAELAVLEGAGTTLTRHRPIVVLEFNSFGFTLHRGVLPQVALTRIQEIFPHVFVVDRVDSSLARLQGPAAAYAFLYANGVFGPTDNLLCSFVDLPVERPYGYGGGVPQRAGPLSAAAELEAMRRTVSWRITAPLRAARRRAARMPSLPHWCSARRPRPDAPPSVAAEGGSANGSHR